MVPPAPTIHFIPLIQFRVTVGLEPIPAVTGREMGYTADRASEPFMCC